MDQRTLCFITLASIALASCSPSDGIDADGAVYDGIDPSDAITLTGTEPFWGAEIGPTANGVSTARFTSPADIDGSAFQAQRFAGNNGLGFSGELGGKSVQIAITPGECSDGMSDRAYPYAATVALGDATLLGCAYSDTQPFIGPDAP
ncbi:MAG: hypothetical protein AAF249_07220 [Pseudomonadota bacterium]